MTYTLPIIAFDAAILPKPEWYREWAWAYDDGHLTDIPRHGARIETAGCHGCIAVTRWFRQQFPDRLIFLAHKEIYWMPRAGHDAPVAWLIPDEEAAIVTQMKFSS